MSPCFVCHEPTRSKGALCANCQEARFIIRGSVNAMMTLHGIPPASGRCVDCQERPATCRDHRQYAKPLSVESVCTPCNIARGPADDLYALIRQHRGLLPPIAEPVIVPVVSVPSDLDKHLQSYQRSIIESALAQYRYNQTATAKALGISFRTLRYRIESLGIQVSNMPTDGY